jgi:DNA gyrase subunit A
VNERNGPLVASFPVEESDEIMLVTDGGQVIRMPVHDIRIIGRGTQGVTLFDVGEGEKVVSVEGLSEVEEEAEDGADETGDNTGGEGPAPAGN